MHRMRPLNPFANPAQNTLQDALDRLEHSDVREPEKREFRSAIHTLAKWLGRVPSEIPAHPAFLRQCSARLNPVALGISKGRLQNVRSLLKRALHLLGIGPAGATWLVPLTPPWQALYDAIPTPYDRELLARFLRFCTGRGCGPEQVDDATVTAFREALEAEDLTAKPFTAAQSAVRIWNRMGETVPGWPQHRLSRLRRSQRYTLTWDDLPDLLVADVEQYLALQAGADPTHPLAPPRPLKPLSMQALRRYILQLVSALHHQGVDVSTFSGLADLCAEERPRRALQYFIERQKKRKGDDTELTTSMISGLAHTLNVIAKHYVQAPPPTLMQTGRFARQLRRRPAGMTEKNRQRLKPLLDPRMMGRFLAYPREEMVKLARRRKPSRLDGVRYSTLLAIEILIVAPMRCHNLAALALDRHIRLPADDTCDAIRVTIPRGDVKNDQPLDYRIPASTGAMIRVYLDRFRPLLLCKPSTALFPSHTGKAKRADTLSKQVSRLLRDELGLDWNPHLFRHLAAHIVLHDDPGNYEGARRLLAHSSVEVTARIYAGHDMRPAVEHYDRLIERIRGPAPVIRPARTRPAIRPGM